MSQRDTGGFTQGRTGSDIPLGMTAVAAEPTRWGEDRAEVGEAVWGWGGGGWHGQAGGSGAEMDEKEAQSQGLVTQWAGVGSGEFYAKSQDLARTCETGIFWEGRLRGT